jgi:hypothetical protein
MGRRWLRSSAPPVSGAPAVSTLPLAAPTWLDRAASLGPTLLVALQLGLILFAFRVFDLEQDSGFLQLAPLVFGGFLVHAVLPLRLRLPFFLFLSLGCFALLMGPAVLVLIALGMGLIGICHLPIRLSLRVALLVVAGAGLAALRVGVGPIGQSPVMVTVMPILGSLFMFRLIIYLYDLQHEKTPATIWERLSYFFLLPNVCFLFFPVVDYQTFRRTYYDTDAAHIYQKGVLWMYRGLTHLLLYRILYYYVVPSPPQVEGLGTVVLFVFGTYLLYLRVSGLFHLITGTLALFGFNLPATNHHYLLASGFNDFWRRSNIYWKDFMMKVFYYPAFMRLRKGGMLRAVVLATVFVFLATWFLHSYQWFWLLGRFPVTTNDAIFWTIFGSLVTANSVWQFRQGKKGTLSKPVFTFRRAFVHAFKVLGMFLYITLLWSFWYSPSGGDWFALLSQSTNSGPMGFVLLAAGLAALVLIGVGVQYARSRGIRFTLLTQEPPRFNRMALVTSLGVLAILGAGLLPMKSIVGEQAGTFIASLQEDRLTAYDAEQVDKGYYDALLATNSLTNQIGGARNQRPPDWKPLGQSDAVIRTDDVFMYRLRPSTTVEFKRVPMTVNQWGMRDQEYTHEKPEGVFRIALMGASIEMGAGVADDETYEAVTEMHLNEELVGQPGTFERYDVLNFSVGGYSVLQHLPLLDEVFPFQPDILVYTGHTIEDTRMVQLLAELIQRGAALPPYVEAIRQEAGVDETTPLAEINQRLEPFEARILREGYEQIVAQCREAGILPVWLFVPRTEEKARLQSQQLPIEQLKNLARESGFLVLSIGDAYDAIEDPEAELFLAPWDDHPNKRANRLLGRRFYDILVENASTLGLTRSAAPAPTTTP